MVLLHVKREESLFLYETPLTTSVADTLKNILEIYNGQLKVKRICSELKDLLDYGVYLPPDDSHVYLNEEKLNVDTKKETCLDFVPTGGYELNAHPNNRRTGLRPKREMGDILNRTMLEALAKVSNENVKSNTCLSQYEIEGALEMLEGAVKIVYEKGLPEYDPIQIEFQNKGDIEMRSNVSMSHTPSVLWFSNKKLAPDKKLSEYFGKNEKSKVIIKLLDDSSDPPTKEPPFNEKERQQMILAEEKRRKELFNMETTTSLHSDEMDKQDLKKRIHGVQKITWM